jgi:hypothetical protein
MTMNLLQYNHGKSWKPGGMCVGMRGVQERFLAFDRAATLLTGPVVAFQESRYKLYKYSRCLAEF